MYYRKKAQGLPINVVVMMIIGILIFGIGLSLFSKISNQGDELISNINERIQSDISSLECNNQDWICSGSFVLKKDRGAHNIFISNHADEITNYNIILEGEEDILNNNKKIGIKLIKECGNILVYYANSMVSIKSGGSASIPLIIKDDGVLSRPCSFTAIAELKTEDGFGIGDGERTPIIIRVE